MNYGPNDYNNIINSTSSLNQAINDLNYISYSSSTQESINDLYEVEKVTNKTTRQIEAESNELYDNLVTLIRDDFGYKQEMYIELVSNGYEEEVFPFHDWLKNFKLDKWTPTKFWLKDLSKISHSLTGNIIFVQNIQHFYEVTKKYSNESYFEIFNICHLSFKDNEQCFSKEQQEECLNRFIFDEDINSFLNSLVDNQEIIPFNKKLKTNNVTFISYINDLFDNTETNEISINEIMHFLSTQKNELEYKLFVEEFTSSITNIINGNHFSLKTQNNIYNKEIVHRYNSFIKLFECDIDFGLGITPILITKLKNIEDNIKKDKKNDFDNMLIELENGYQAYMLNCIVQNKPDNKNKKKI